MPTFRCPGCGHAAKLSKERMAKGGALTCAGCGAVNDLKKSTQVRPRTQEGPAAAAAAATEPGGRRLPPDLIPGYELQELLGEGGMGSVYKARQLSLDRLVAVKILSRDLSAITDFVKRFEREAKALASLNHPNITSVFDFRADAATGFCWFAMEFVDGQTLAQLLKQARPEPERALELFLGICDAIVCSHSCAIIHRDLKPGNVLVTRDGRVKVTDFGLAGMLGAERTDGALTKSNVVMGTVNYMAPEQRHDARSVDHRADIFSLGVILYELLTRKLPLGAFELPSRASGATLSARFDEVVLRSLAPEPAGRYQSVAELRADLAPLRGRVSTAPACSRDATVVRSALPAEPPTQPPIGASSPTLPPGSAPPVPRSDVPVTLPPTTAVKLERAAGRVFLIGLALAALAAGVTRLLPPQGQPATLAAGPAQPSPSPASVAPPAATSAPAPVATLAATPVTTLASLPDPLLAAAAALDTGHAALEALRGAPTDGTPLGEPAERAQGATGPLLRVVDLLRDRQDPAALWSLAQAQLALGDVYAVVGPPELEEARWRAAVAALAQLLDLPQVEPGRPDQEAGYFRAVRNLAVCRDRGGERSGALAAYQDALPHLRTGAVAMELRLAYAEFASRSASAADGSAAGPTATTLRDAATSLQAAAGEAPLTGRPLLVLVDLELQLGDSVAALALTTGAGEDPALTLRRGRALLLGGYPEEAVTCLMHPATTGDRPTRAAAAYHLARATGRLGQGELAAGWLRAALEAGSDQREACLVDPDLAPIDAEVTGGRRALLDAVPDAGR